MLVACASNAVRWISRSPNGQVQVAVADHVAHPLMFEPKLIVLARTHGKEEVIYLGKDDWYAKRAYFRWSQDSRRVTVVACGRISSPVALTYDFEAQRATEDSEDLAQLRRENAKAWAGRAPKGCSDKIDAAFWGCCGE